MSALDDKPFGLVYSDGSMADEGEAMGRDPKFLGASSETKKFEGKTATSNCSSRQMSNSGRD